MRKITPFLLAAALCLPAACVDDKGNYSYSDIDPIAIAMDTAFTGIVGEPLTVRPTLSAAHLDTAACDFDWQAISTTADTATHLSTDRALDYTVRLAPGEYRLVFTARRSGSATFSRQSAALSVRTPLSSGWLVLCDDGGRARLDMYSFIKEKTYTDLLSGTVPGTWQTPYAIACLPNANVSETPFYLLTADGTTRLSDVDFAWRDAYRLSYEMGSSADAGIRPDAIAENGPGKLVIAGGKPYYCDNTMGDGLFASARRNSFDVAPAIGYDALSDHMAPAFLMYDTTNRRFVVCAALFSSTDVLGTAVAGDIALSTLGSFYQFPVGNASAFDLPAAGRYSLVHMENTRYAPLGDDHGTTYAILADGDERRLYGFAMGDLVAIRYPDKYGYAYAKVITRDLSACPGITSATHFAFSSLRNCMYYVADGSVYRADLTAETPTVSKQFDLPAGERISCFKFCLPTQSANARRVYDLLVGTVDADGHGTLRVYDGWTTEGDFSGAQPASVLTGFATIKDVLLREVITEY